MNNMETLAYFLLGNNLIIGPHIRRQLRFLEENVPPAFRHRRTDDLGCGDGKVTVLLKDILLPSRLRGFDVNPGLVRRARKRGIDAEVKNLDEAMPSGELAIVWGVLHHLEDCAGCLERIKENYRLIFIREPVKSGRISWLETGHPLKKEEIELLIREHLPGSQVFYCGNSVLIFYTAKAD